MSPHDDPDTLASQVADAIQQGLYTRAYRLTQAVPLESQPAIAATLLRACAIVVEREIEAAKRDGVSIPQVSATHRAMMRFDDFANALHAGRVPALTRQRLAKIANGT